VEGVRLTRKLLRSGGEKVAAVVLIAASGAFAQQVVGPEQIPCSEEIVRLNLELREKRKVSGELRDQTGTPFSNSKVLLSVDDAKGKFVLYRSVLTDKNGRFDLGLVDAGKYRFLPAPNRGWKQPREVTCTGEHACAINLDLQLNPSDQPFAGCPIR
jgi:hypothetical protein